ncbi:Halomucin [Colletotrichum sp. SAR11_239]|nr:Halomucin [Colletotrichum sp. SAR11_239]
MAATSHTQLEAAFWALLMSQFFLLGFAQLEANPAALDCIKTTRVPFVYTTVLTIYAPADDPVTIPSLRLPGTSSIDSSVPGFTPVPFPTFTSKESTDRPRPVPSGRPASGFIGPWYAPPGKYTTVLPLIATTTEPDGSRKTANVTWLSIDLPTSTTSDGMLIPTVFPVWRCISLNLCNPICLIPEIQCYTSPEKDDGFSWPPAPPGLGKEIHKRLNEIRIDIDLDDDFLLWFFGRFSWTIRWRLRVLFNLGTNLPNWRIGTKIPNWQSITLAPYCTRPCVVSKVSNHVTNTWTTSCDTARCSTTELCTSVRTTTTTTYTTKKPKATGACRPGKCPACSDSKVKRNDGLEKRSTLEKRTIPEDVIVQDTMTGPETWEKGETDWWENMRRIVKYYGPGYHQSSPIHADSSAIYEDFSETYPMGGGSGPVWGCAMVAVFSPTGIYTNHMWEVPNFSIPDEDREAFDTDTLNYDEAHYFRQNVHHFLRHGSASWTDQKQYPALRHLVEVGDKLDPKNTQFYRVILFVPIDVSGNMVYPRANQEIIDLLTGRLIGIDKKHITIYGYKRRKELGEDHHHDESKTPPPEFREAEPWHGLLSWMYTPKGDSGKRELVVRFERDVIHRETWCGDGLIAGPDGMHVEKRSTSSISTRQDDTCPVPQFCMLKKNCGSCGGSSSKELQKRDPWPRQVPTPDEVYLTNDDKMVQPEDSPEGELKWWRSMRNVIDQFGPGFGGPPDSWPYEEDEYPRPWSTSEITFFDREKITEVPVERPRFGGSGPVWGCSMLIVVSPKAVWTSHFWEVPGHTRGEAEPNNAWLQEAYPLPTEQYLKEDIIDHIGTGNFRGNKRSLTANPLDEHENPGLAQYFQPGGPFNVQEMDFVKAFIVSRGSLPPFPEDVMMHHSVVVQIKEKLLLDFGLSIDEIVDVAYRPHFESDLGKSREDHPEWGVFSWEYHPHDDSMGLGIGFKALRLRWEKNVVWENLWCGDGHRVVPPTDDDLFWPPLPPIDPENAGGDPMIEGRQATAPACKIPAKLTPSSLITFTRTSVALPLPTESCVSNSECGSLSCPENRQAVCFFDHCRCVIKERNDNITITSSLTNARTRAWSTRVASLNTTTSFPLTVETPWTGTEPFTTVVLSEWEPIPTKTIPTVIPQPSGAGSTCAWARNCITLPCLDDMYPACVKPADGNRYGCYCVMRPVSGDACAVESECNEMRCPEHHFPSCSRQGKCRCEPIPRQVGAACKLDSHCAGLMSCNIVQSGFCNGGSCECAIKFTDDTGCAKHADCTYVLRNNETHPYKTCSRENKCELTVSEPFHRPERAGEVCKESKECVGITCDQRSDRKVCESGKTVVMFFQRLILGVATLLSITTNTVVARGSAENNTYDYIVIGSGPGGGPLASNLARAGFSTLLLEAGDDESLDIGTALANGGYALTASNSWGFWVKHHADPEVELHNNHLTWRFPNGTFWVGNGERAPPGAELMGVYYPRGATIGGSAVVNAMGTLLPSDGDWDFVANITGDGSWRHENMRRMFEKVEKNNYLPERTQGHGFGGILETNMGNGTQYLPFPGLVEVYKAQIRSLGLDPEKVIEMLGSDPNYLADDRDFTEGFWGMVFHANARWERSTPRDYIFETIAAKNEDGSAKYPLTLSSTSLATKVLFE